MATKKAVTYGILKNKFIVWYYALWMVKVLEKVFRRIICSFAVNNWSNCGDTETRCLHYFRRPRREPYINTWYTFWRTAQQWKTAQAQDLARLLISWYSIISEILGFIHSTGLILVFDGDGENRQMGMHLSVKWDRNTRKVKSSHMLLRSLGQVNDLFSSTGLTVCVYIGGFWLLRFYGVHFTHDSQNSFSAHHDSPTANMVMAASWK